MWETICLKYPNHISLHFAICPEPAAPSLISALLPVWRCRSPTGSLRERSTFSFHPLLEDKHQSHLAAHPYSWAAYKYLIAASLQLFSRGERRKELHMHTPENKHCAYHAMHARTQAEICTVLSSAFFSLLFFFFFLDMHVVCVWLDSSQISLGISPSRLYLPGQPTVR